MGIHRVTACGLVLAALAALTAAGCGGTTSTADLIAMVRQLDAVEALAVANDWRTSRPDVSSTLTANAVEFSFPGGEEVSVPLPADRMVLAVAPYVMETHPCDIHSISGCPGEMAGVAMAVHAQAADGTVLVDETMTAMDNGFIEIWLPRDREIDLTIQAEGKTATATVTTYDTSNTCLPELKLQ